MMLDNIRKQLKAQKIDAYVIPMGDPHANEYLSPQWQLIKAISGFSGSAGTLVITADFAGLWTDSRYFGQAEREIEAQGFVLMRLVVPHTAEHIDWLLEYLPANALIAGDTALFSVQKWQYLASKLEEAHLRLLPLDRFWAQYWEIRPLATSESIFVHPDQYVGLSRTLKIQQLRTALTQSTAQACLLSALDEIAWLLNLRGKDIPYNPLFFAFLWLDAERCVLFIDKDKIGPELNALLADAGIECVEYETLNEFLQAEGDALIWSDPSSLNTALYQSIPETHWQLKPSWVRSAKAEKHPKEMEFIRSRHDKEGLVWLKAWYWREQQLALGPLMEYELATYMESLRHEEDTYLGPSFAPIVAYGPNGAMNHYSPSENQQAEIKTDSLLLIDTGGQYLDGTTDMTRTFATGVPTQAQIEAYTYVLQGLIAVSSLGFPAGTSGSQLDVLARQALWQAGLNYGHGTGHGVGYCLNVHEGPQAIGTGSSGSAGASLKVGMLTSVEPGYYLAGAWGIRIENLLLCVEDEQAGWLRFESLGFCPLEPKLIAWDLLSEGDKQWVSNFQGSVYHRYEKRILPTQKAWLQEKTFAK